MEPFGLPSPGLSNFSPALLVCLINRERVNYGLNPLGLLPGLNRASEYHNGIMAKQHKLAIQLPDETPYIEEIVQRTPGRSWQRFGILVGQNFADELNYVKYMLQDESSRPVLLGDFTHYGVAKKDTQEGPWWTQEFADDGQEHNYPICPGLSSSDSSSQPIPHLEVPSSLSSLPSPLSSSPLSSSSSPTSPVAMSPSVNNPIKQLKSPSITRFPSTSTDREFITEPNVMRRRRFGPMNSPVKGRKRWVQREDHYE